MEYSKFDYQSDRHCSKTDERDRRVVQGLITSQIDTAPKQVNGSLLRIERLITSQIDTAPKHKAGHDAGLLV